MVYWLWMSPDDHWTRATALSYVHANQQRLSHRERAVAVLAPLLVQVEWLALAPVLLGSCLRWSASLTQWLMRNN